MSKHSMLTVADIQHRLRNERLGVNQLISRAIRLTEGRPRPSDGFWP